MSLADFQNPIANMPLMQQMQQAQSHQLQVTPYLVQEKMDEELNEELTTVQDTKEQEEKDQIREEDEDRGAQQQKNPRRRAKNPPEEEEEPQKPKVSDGIHGRFLDLEA